MASSQSALLPVSMVVVALAASPVRAAETGNSDWPCVQRKVATLTAAQMWDGPPVDGLVGWSDNEEIRKLVTFLASRRVPLEDATAAVAKFAAAQPPDDPVAFLDDFVLVDHTASSTFRDLRELGPALERRLQHRADALQLGGQTQ